MTDDELEQLLSGAFAARARAEIGDEVPAPAPRFESEAATAPARGHRITRVVAPLAAAAAVVAIVVLVPRASDDHRGKVAIGGPTTSVSTSRTVTPNARPVHMKLLNSDGDRYGIGMPVIAYFSKRITDARALQAATVATVDGRVVHGAWYFETSAAHKGYPVEAHFRLKDYWPAHATVHLSIPVKGLSAGRGLGFDDSLSLDFTTGASDIATVDDTTHELTLVRDGKSDGRFRVSLGAPGTPTTSGTKVIMEKGTSICLSGPGYDECGIKDTQRLTYDGEFLHAAPWNVKNIAHGIDSSNGCTNLMPRDAATLYRRMVVGDLVVYPNANGPRMTLGAGYGDWNVSWDEWLTGGLVPTR